MAVTCDKNYAYLQLLRGGICIRKENVNDPDDPAYLNLQIGSPPETLKDTLNNFRWPAGVPRDYVVPVRLIDPRSVVTLAELEFPGYYHFFIRPERRNIRIHLFDPEHETHLRTMLSEALFGPKVRQEAFQEDFVDPTLAFDIARECEYFNPFALDDIFEFHVRKPDESKLTVTDRYRLGVQQNRGIYYYKLYENGNASPIFSCSEIDLFSRKKMLQKREAMARRPDFAIAAIGNSTGFDELGETSGFVIWINGHGILVDPPADTRFWLMENKVLPEETDRVILTHCHADHDAGLLQRILENDHLDIYTTRTVWNSFHNKYGRLIEELQPYYRWIEIKIGETVRLEGAAFDFFYSLHSIPTIAFTVNYKNINVFYSSDVRFSRSTYEDMKAKGKLDASRYEYFTARHPRLFKNAHYILHEAGGDPLHTSIDELDALDLSVKRKTFVYHLSERDYESHRRRGINDFTLITSGMGKHHIKVFSDDEQIPQYPDESFLKYCLLFHEMKMRDVKAIQQSCLVRKIKRGTVLFRKNKSPSFEGDEADAFVYLIYSGMAAVVGSDGKMIKEYHKFDFVGETAVLLNQPRNADVVALEDLVAYAVPNVRFKEIMGSYSELFGRLESNREGHIESVLARSFFTVSLSWRARTDLQLIGNLKTYSRDEEIMDGNSERFLFLVSGGVKIKQGERVLLYPVMFSNKLRIDHVGDPGNPGPWGIQSVRCIESDTTILEISKDDYLDFCRRHGTFRWRWSYLKTYFPEFILNRPGP